MVIRLSIQLPLEMAYKLHQRSSRSDAELAEIFNIERDYDLTIKPLHVDAKDPLLVRHFIVDVPDKTTAELVKARLLQSKSVEGVYSKPKARLA
jgi:hypothetical protein